MPAQGRGANLDTSRRARREPTPTPRQRVAMQAPSTNLRSTALSSEPFRPAQQQAQRTVVKAQRALPKEPTPDIPRLPRPTPAQAHAALAVAQAHQRASGKPPATYWRELSNDPRSRAYVSTVAHYAKAGQAHAAEVLGRTEAGGGENAAAQFSPQALKLARAEAAAIGRALLAAPHATANASAPRSGLASLPIVASVRNYLGERAAEDIPALAKVGSAAVKLATEPADGEGKLRGKGLLGNALLDIADIGRFPLIGGVQAGKAAVQLGSTGSTRGFQDIATNVAKGIEQGAVGQLVQGNPGAALKALREHPVLSATEVAGLESAVGRSAGALTRAAGGAASESALGRLGSTVRSPIALTEDAGAARRLVKERTGSKDLLRKGVQTLVDRKTRRPVIDPATGRPVLHTQEGSKVPVLHARSEREQRKLQQHRANEEQGLERDAEVFARDRAAQAEQKASRRSVGGVITPVPRAGSRVATDIAQGLAEGVFRTAKTLPEDLRKRAATIDEQISLSKASERSGKGLQPYRSRKERAVAEHAAETYRKASSDPKLLARAAQIESVGLEYAKRLNELDPKQADLHVYDPQEIKRARLSTYAVAHMGAKHDGEALRDSKGRVLLDEQIEADARAHGRDPDTLAYLPHKPGGLGKGAYHKQPRIGNYPVSSGLTRTFALFNRGAHAVGRQVVHDELTNKATTISRAQHALKTIRSNFVLHPQYEELKAAKARGETLTSAQRKIVAAKGAMVPKDAQELAKRLTEEGKPYVAARLAPAKLSQADRNDLLGGANPARMESVHETLLQRHLIKEGDNSQTANAGLVPAHLFQRHQALTASKGALEKGAQLVGAPFRVAVLAQPKWLTGDFVEPQLVRLPIKGAGLVNIPGMVIDLRAQKATIRALERSGDTETADVMRAVFHGSSGVTGRRSASVRRTYEDLPEGAARDLFKLGHAMRNWGVFKSFADLATLIPKTFFGINSKIGELAQRQAFGKNVRMSIQEHTGSWYQSIKLSQAALDDVAKGLIETPRQVRYGEQAIDMLGRYNGYGPGAKAAITTLAPFIPWVLNSVRFVYWTLPAHHSTLFLVLQKEAEATLASWEKEHADLPPGELRYGLRAPDGGVIPISKYLPYGVSVGLSEAIREPHGKQAADAGLQTFTNSVGPQVSGVLAALSGKDFTGEDLRLPQTRGNPEGQAGLLDRLLIAANQGAGATVPNYSMAQRLLEGGGTAYGNATLPGDLLRALQGREPNVKPGSKHQSAVNRTLNPLREIYLHAPSTASSSEPAPAGSGPSARQRLAAGRAVRSSDAVSARQRLAQRRRVTR